MNLDRIIVVDTETGGLDPDRHPIWEIAVGWPLDGSWFVEHQFVEHDPALIDPWVLENTGYAERYDPGVALTVGEAVDWFADAADRRHIVGMVPSFDEERLRRLSGGRTTWHYHLIDVEALIVGYLAAFGDPVELPWNSDELSKLVGVDPNRFERHTAQGDVRWSIALLSAIGMVPS